jgi:catechol 2,3-dioxygenase-like lactoylglutathione lyase family enzyme
MVHFILYVRDQRRSTSFWAAALDAHPTLDVPGMTEFTLGPATVLGLMPAAGIKRLLPALADPDTARDVPRAEIYLVVQHAGACHARAVSAGARELSPLEERSWGHRVAYCLDPDGHVLAFAEPAT